MENPIIPKIQWLVIISQQNFVHVQNIVAITLLEFGWEQNEISITFEFELVKCAPEPKDYKTQQSVYHVNNLWNVPYTTKKLSNLQAGNSIYKCLIYQYRNSHFKNNLKTMPWSSHIHNRNPYTGKTILNWSQCWKFSWKSYRTAGPVSVKSFRSYWEVLGPTNEGPGA